MVHKVLVVLQMCTSLVKMEPGSCSESCVTSFNYESEIVDIKVEGDTHVEVVQKPIPITFPSIKPETEVSFVCVHY